MQLTNEAVGWCMGYIKNNLTREEKVIYHTSLSGVIFLPPLLLAMFVVIAYFSVGNIPTGLMLMRGIWIICLFKTLVCILTFHTSEFGITNKRVLGKKGYIYIESLDIVLDKVEAVRVNRGFLGFIAGYGDIEVTGTGGTHEIIRYIPNPLLFRKILQEQIDTAVENGDMPTPSRRKSRNIRIVSNAMA